MTYDGKQIPNCNEGHLRCILYIGILQCTHHVTVHQLILSTIY